MTDQNTNEQTPGGEEETKPAAKSEWANKLDTMGWALFFIWVGIAFLLDFGFGVGLLGIGVITLGVQVARTRYGLKTETFWIIVGVLFFLGGLWQLFEPDIPLIPILLIIAGLIVLLSVMRKK
ncbi:MAG: hypothetical protein JSW64_04410 [Candidatus Zixiibacteriota bacterium]|nr:MAG: hypothetical protein JSW64_04410 [candidate division Zixibacteria bacterium]